MSNTVDVSAQVPAPRPTDTGTVPAPATVPATPVIGDPAPLGLAAFALTTFCLSIFNSGIMANPPLEAMVLPLALFYGGLSQLLAGMWEFRKGNTFGATAFTSYGAFWLSFAAYAKFVAPGLPKATAAEATALFLLGWAIFTTYMFFASLAVSAAIAGVFLLLAATFILLTIGAYTGHTMITHVGGYLGLATAAVAWYTSFAGVLHATYRRTVLPTWPKS